MIQKSNMLSWTHSAIHLLVCWYVNMSVCVPLRTKAWSALCLSPSLWTPSGAMLILQNHVLQASWVFPVTGHHMLLCGPWWNRCGRGSETGLSQVLTLAAPAVMLFPGPMVLSAFLSFGEELLSCPVPRVDVGTDSGCVFCCLAASPHRNLTNWNGNSTGNVAVLP